MATTLSRPSQTDEGTPDVHSIYAAPPTSRPARERLVSLDVFRGLTVAGMLLVNNPGTWDSIYPPLEHAAWNGWTPTDLIFPFFLFIAGITTHISLSSRGARGADESAIRRQVIRRGFLIFLFGFLLNGFPFFSWGPVGHIAHATVLQRVFDRLAAWRIMGVLQRIGLAYVCAALLAYGRGVKRQVATIVVLLYGYWFAMTLLPVPGGSSMGYLALGGRGTNLAAWTDRQLLDWSRFGLGNHIWAGGVVFDPEGPFSTIPAIATCMLGILAGRWIVEARPIEERLNALFAAGALATMAGMVWNWSFPINKSLWTSSYVLFSAGAACLTLATIMWLVDVRKVTGWTRFFVVYGSNPLAAFVGSGLMARCIYSIFEVTYGGKPIALQSYVFRSLFATWLSPVNASLAFAVAFVLLWYAILSVLYRRQIFFKV